MRADSSTDASHEAPMSATTPADSTGFSLPPVKGRSLALAGSDLKGEVSLVNVFAS